ncbi:hypothetical protein ACQRXC_26665 (plasmid) [Niallia taxi]|nr:hypothetical protein [Niallia taxi]MDK8643313.1 hypothetical protein [Niallia taxi]
MSILSRVLYHSWEGKAVLHLLSLKHYQKNWLDIVRYTEEELIKYLRQAVKRSIGIKKIQALKETANRTIGIRRCAMMAK